MAVRVREILCGVSFVDIMKYLVEKKDVFYRCQGLNGDKRRKRAQMIVCSYFYTYQRLLDKKPVPYESKACIKILPDKRDIRDCMWYETIVFDPDDEDSPFDLKGFSSGEVVDYMVQLNYLEGNKEITLPYDLVAGEILWAITDEELDKVCKA